MYSNISGKIKILAYISAILGIITSFFGGLYFIIQSIVSYSDEHLAGIGFLIMIFGSLSSWAYSWLIYGFGELIEKTTAIARNTLVNSPKVSLTKEMEKQKLMETLISWRDNNLITQEEFEIKKQELLRGITNDFSN